MARDQSLTPSMYCQRLVLALPRDAGRAFGTGMPQLQRDLRVGVRVDESGDAFPAVTLRLVPQARTAGRDARIGGRAGHLGHHHAGAPHRARAQVHEVIVRRQAVDA
jgi:hypothetical protein